MKTSTDKQEPLLTGHQIAAHYRVDPHTVRRWRYAGCPSEIYGYKMIRYRRSEVEAWLQQKRMKE